MSVAVVGANGFIGSRLVASLEARGVAALPLSSSGRTGLDPATGRVAADFAFEGDVRAVVYLAQSPHYRRGIDRLDHLMQTNCQSAIDLACRACSAGVRRFVYVSTGSVYAPSFDPLVETSSLRTDLPYPLSKVHAERALGLLSERIELQIVRPFCVFGPGQESGLVPGLIQRVRTNQQIFTQPHPEDATDTQGLRISLCDVDDAADILARIAIEGGGPSPMNLASSEAWSIREIAAAIGAGLGSEVDIAMADEPRAFDLVANVDRLLEHWAPRFTPIRQTIDRTLAAADTA